MALYFPAPKWDQTSYKQGSPQFGHRRAKGGRLHAACDLYAPLESDVVAVDAGIIVELSLGRFANNTHAISIQHEGIGVIRYGEVVKIPEEYKKTGVKVEKGGLVIGKVGRAVASFPPMLHLELYDGSGSGSLSDKVHKIEYYNEDVLKDGNYQRRADLMNPTKFLDRLWLEGVK